MVSVNIKHHVYLAASGQRKITTHTWFTVWVFHSDTTATTSTRLYTQIVSRNAFFRALVSNLFFYAQSATMVISGLVFLSTQVLVLHAAEKEEMTCLCAFHEHGKPLWWDTNNMSILPLNFFGEKSNSLFTEDQNACLLCHHLENNQ